MKRFFNTPVVILLIVLLVMNFMDGEFDNPIQWFIDRLIMLPGIIIGLSFHEFAHAAASNILGDPTPKMQGRLTVNPMAHIDPVGFIALMFVGFGWGVPVEIDPRHYKNQRFGELITALAGVVMNFLIAIVFTVILKFTIEIAGSGIEGTWGYYLNSVIQQIILINLVLMIFNLLPVPPLDGFGIITQLFKLDRTDWYWKIYEYGPAILMVLIIFDVTSYIISPLVIGLYQGLINIIIL
ncbi:MAG: site-2 protease family protein [Clostridia bacterium]|nr:site-2 protease family protein [Clostridia bacterium]